MNVQEEGKVFAERAVNILDSAGDMNALGDAYLELGNYCNIYTDQMLQRMILQEKGAEAYALGGDKEKHGKALKSLGEFYYMTGDYKSAINELQKALRSFVEARYPERHGVYDIMMTASTQIGDYEKAIRYGLLALKTAEEVHDTSKQLCAIYNHLGVTYIYMEEYDKAQLSFEAALPMAERSNDTFDIITIGKNLANSYALAKRPEEGIALLKRLDEQYSPLKFTTRLMLLNIYTTIYVRMKQYDAAKPYVEELLNVFNSHDTLDPLQLQTYNPLISYYMATGQYKKVIPLCKYDISFSSKYQFVNRLKISYETMAKVDSALGDYQSALQNYKMYGVIKDSLYNESKSWQISQLQIEYESEKKDKEIEMLTNESLIQKNKLQQASMQRNVTFGGISLSLVIIGLLFSRYRIKQKANRKLETQQKEISEKNHSLQHLLNEKEWLLKEIHHRTKNNLQTVISLLNSQSIYLQSDAALSAIQDSKHRVQAMSLIHQKLYRSENVSSIDMHAYIVELVEYLKDCFNIGQRIRFEMSIATIAVDVSEAVPLGLILNEAITNAIKYAFPDNREGIINISLEHVIREQYVLTISDNGVGISPAATDAKNDSLGMSLMKGLAEDIDGTFTLENSNGTLLKVSFKHDSTINRMAIESMVSV